MAKEEQIYYLRLFILSFVTILLAVPIMLMLLWPKAEGNLLYLRLMAGYPIALTLIGLGMRRSGWKRLSDLSGRIDKTLFAVILAALFAISAISSIGNGGVTVNENSTSSIAFSFLISILLIPLQCYAEELIFRILPQRIALSRAFESPVRDKVAVTIISSAFFALLHLPNSEAKLFDSMAISFIYYFVSAAYLNLLSFIEKGYTSPIAYHTANNLFIAVVINRKEASTIPSEPFFFFTGNFDTFNSIISLVWAMIVITAVVAIYSRRQSRRAEIGKEEQKEEENT